MPSFHISFPLTFNSSNLKVPLYRDLCRDVENDNVSCRERPPRMRTPHTGSRWHPAPPLDLVRVICHVCPDTWQPRLATWGRVWPYGDEVGYVWTRLAVWGRGWPFEDEVGCEGTRLATWGRAWPCGNRVGYIGTSLAVQGRDWLCRNEVGRKGTRLAMW